MKKLSVAPVLLAFPLLFSSLTQAQTLESIVLVAEKAPVYFELDAKLEPVHQSTISAQTSGAIKAIFVDVNDTAKPDDLLIVIDDTQQRAQLEQAKANLAQAEAQNKDAQLVLERNRRLVKQGTLSQGDFDSSEARAKSMTAQVQAAKAMLQQAQEQLAYTQVKAPYGGVVKARHVEVGELVNPGQPLMTGMALEPLRAVADLPQQVAKQYQTASQISVILDEDSIIPTNVVLFPYADEQYHSVRVRAQLPENSPTYAGQWAKLRVQTAEKAILRVPQTAVLQRSELSSVYVVINGKPQLRQVRLGNQAEQYVEVLAGLKAGDRVVVDALAQLAAIAKEQ